MECNIEIIDNYLSKEHHENIKSTLTSLDFPWYLQKDCKVGKRWIEKNVLEDSRIDFQFIHGFYKDFFFHSHHFNLILPIIDQLKPSALIRIKANLTTYANKVMPFHYHLDNEDSIKCKTAIYYVNTTNGPTIFETGEKIECIQNRMIIFDSTIKHTGTTHTDEKFRCVLNFNYYS
jgi:hypothetical protein